MLISKSNTRTTEVKSTISTIGKPSFAKASEGKEKSRLSSEALAKED